MTRKEKGYRKRPPQSISSLVSGVVGPILERRAGMTTALLVAWPTLIGGPMGKSSLPEKIVWPRRASEVSPFEPATLVVACEGPQAVLIQHETCQILEKVNNFFGYDAIKSIRIVQKPVSKPASLYKPPKLSGKVSRSDRERVQHIVGVIDNPDLRDRLQKLGERIVVRNKGKS